MARSAPFTSQNDAFSRAKKFWACRGCGQLDQVKPPNGMQCPECGETKTWYLMSQAEADRFAELWLLLGAKKISSLETQKTFELCVNGKKICSYRCDFFYRNEDRMSYHHRDKERRPYWVVEDSKPPEFQTDVSKFKIALFDAIYEPKWGITVDLIRGRRR